MTLLDRLRARKLPEQQVALPSDPVAYAAAERQVEIEERMVLRAKGDDRLDPETVAAALAAARAALAAQPIEVFTVRCLPANEWEMLVAEHPPTAEQRSQGWQWDVETFRPALLAATVSTAEGENDLDVLDWQQLARDGNIAIGELDLLFVAAVQLNTRQPQVSTGKG